LFTFLAVLLFICGPGLLYRLATGDILYSARGGMPPWPVIVLDRGLTPSFMLSGLAFHSRDFWLDTGKPDWATIAGLLMALIGLHIYMVAIVAMGWLTCRSVRQQSFTVARLNCEPRQ
jgi:hypothetical protein